MPTDLKLTEAVIGSALEVANVLGSGFLEKVYERALSRELALRGVSAKPQISFPVCYKGSTWASMSPIWWLRKNSS